MKHIRYDLYHYNWYIKSFDSLNYICSLHPDVADFPENYRVDEVVNGETVSSWRAKRINRIDWVKD